MIDNSDDQISSSGSGNSIPNEDGMGNSLTYSVAGIHIDDDHSNGTSNSHHDEDDIKGISPSYTTAAATGIPKGLFPSLSIASNGGSRQERAQLSQATASISSVEQGKSKAKNSKSPMFDEKITNNSSLTSSEAIAISKRANVMAMHKGYASSKSPESPGIEPGSYRKDTPNSYVMINAMFPSSFNDEPLEPSKSLQPMQNIFPISNAISSSSANDNTVIALLNAHSSNFRNDHKIEGQILTNINDKRNKMDINNNNNSNDSSDNINNGGPPFPLTIENIQEFTFEVEYNHIIKKSLKGELTLGEHMVIFTPHEEELAKADWFPYEPAKYFAFSYNMVSKVQRNATYLPGYGKDVVLQLRDLRQLLFKFNDASDAQKAEDKIKSSAFAPIVGPRCFAFVNFEASSRTRPNLIRNVDYLVEEWKRLGIIREYQQKIENSLSNSNSLSSTSQDRPPWIVSSINQDFTFCETYPARFVVPSTQASKLTELSKCFRENRIPVLSWWKSSTGASIWRGSEPYSAISDISIEDEAYIEAIRLQTPERSVRFVDCEGLNSKPGRSIARGDTGRYIGCGLTNERIDKIQNLRASHKLLGECVSGKALLSSSDYLFNIEQTGWLSQIRSLLSSSLKLAISVGYKNLAAVVYCQHGWDRTTQIVSLAQIFLDPYYRTLKGFRVLIEKEWILFGYPFKQRNGLGKEESDSDQLSPVFLQFLDCVWQLVNQFPIAFEISDTLLLFLAEHQYTCQFGDFLHNCEKDRVRDKVRESTKSVWDYIFEHQEQFTNPLFFPSKFESFFPNDEVLCTRVTLWQGYFNPMVHKVDPVMIDNKQRARDLINKEKELQEKIQLMKENIEKLKLKIQAPNKSDSNTEEDFELLG